MTCEQSNIYTTMCRDFTKERKRNAQCRVWRALQFVPKWNKMEQFTIYISLAGFAPTPYTYLAGTCRFREVTCLCRSV